MDVIYSTGFMALIYFSYQYFKAEKKFNSPIVLAKSLYAELKSPGEQNKMSIFVLAGRMKCLPDETKNRFFNQLRQENLSYSELLALERNFEEQKKLEANALDINPENTPSAVLERWTLEYRNKN
jgi:hypothetical protein